jgi:glycosyltransferase involved in cell wall biosynthesis
MKVAVVHDWLATYAGAERVLEQILMLYPEADLYSLIDFIPPSERAFLKGRPVRTSFVQRLPWARRKYRNYLALMPLAVEQFDLSTYDLVISSSYAVSKGVLTSPHQLHICFCHSPARYAWDLQHQYLREAQLTSGLGSWVARYMLHRFRIWDVRTANGVDDFIANSHFIAARIWKVYRRESTVIYPPVDVHAFTPGGSRQDFYLTASRMVPYKRMDLIVEAFATMPHRRLVVVGDGPEAARIRSRGASNIEFLGQQPIDVLRDRLRCAKAFIFAAEEDFGIAPVEAQACGTPVLAYGKGGALETIRGLEDDAPTGILFPEQTVASLVNAVECFELEGGRIDPAACRRNAERFNPERFRKELADYINGRCRQFETGKCPPQTTPR